MDKPCQLNLDRLIGLTCIVCLCYCFLCDMIFVYVHYTMYGTTNSSVKTAGDFVGLMIQLIGTKVMSGGIGLQTERAQTPSVWCSINSSTYTDECTTSVPYFW